MSRSRELVFAVALLGGAVSLPSIQPAAFAQAAPHQSGTVKSVSGDTVTLTTQSGQDVTVTVPTSAKVLVVAPGAKTLAGASSGSVSDIAPGDRALVSGAAGEAGPSMTAVRIVLMKASAIQQSHAAEEQAWAQGVGGIVKTVDPATGTIAIVNGMRVITVHATPQTTVRRYANGSVRFQDAVTTSLSSVQPGDQLRVRGTKSPDGTSIQADEIVVGTFGHYSGLITAVNTSAGTITLKDLATKRPVTVAITSNSDLHQLPPAMAQMMAARMKGGSGGAGARGAGGEGGHQRPAGGEESSEQRSSRAGMGLSNMMARLPAVTVAELKPGDAVLVVATTPAGSETPTAVTLLSGVDPLLRAPSGQTMQLSPWNMGSGGGAAGGGDEGGDAGGGTGGPGGGQ